MIKHNRVVITGIGVLAPNGIGIEQFWRSLLAGQSGIGPITLFDARDFKSRIAGEVKGFEPSDFIEPELKPKRLARHTQLAYAAALLALKDANLDIKNLKLPSPTPVVIGVSTSAIDVIEKVFYAVTEVGPNRAAPNSAAASIPQAAANFIADRLGASAHATTVSSACPSGLDATADAAARCCNFRCACGYRGDLRAASRTRNRRHGRVAKRPSYRLSIDTQTGGIAKSRNR